MPIMRLSILLAFLSVAFSSAAARSQAVLDVPSVPPPDESYLDRPFNSCKAKPTNSVQLTPAEKCWSKELAARCSAADDCLVSCIASGVARDLGGGCWHSCFQVKFNLSQWQPPGGAEACRKLGHVNGI